jgi:hypothetical protein
MSREAWSIAFFSLLLALNIVAPLTLGVLAAINNTRVRTSARREAAFWAILVGYLAIVGLLGWSLISLESTPQVEGLAGFSAAGVTGMSAFPGSIVPILSTGVLSYWQFPRPAILGSLSVWFVIGCVAWGFFNAAGLRWLIHTKRRSRARAARKVEAAI